MRTGYDRGHNFGSNSIPNAINPCVDPSLNLALGKIIGIVREHQRMTLGHAELDCQERENQRVKALVMKKLRNAMLANTSRQAFTAMQLGAPLFAVTQSIPTLYAIVGTVMLATFSDLNALPDGNKTVPACIWTDKLYAHQVATQETYQLSNITTQFGEYCNNSIVAHVDAMIRGMCVPSAGGRHLLMYLIPYFWPVTTLSNITAQERENKHVKALVTKKLRKTIIAQAYARVLGLGSHHTVSYADSRQDPAPGHPTPTCSSPRAPATGRGYPCGSLYHHVTLRRQLPQLFPHTWPPVPFPEVVNCIT